MEPARCRLLSYLQLGRALPCARAHPIPVVTCAAGSGSRAQGSPYGPAGSQRHV